MAEKTRELVPLTCEEAIAAMKAGERLVNGMDNYGIAHYYWHNDQILKSDSYYDLHGEGEEIPKNELPALYHTGIFRSLEQKAT